MRKQRDALLWISLATLGKIEMATLRRNESKNGTAKLKEETNIISKQSAANQVRLDLMFQIIKARSENDAPRDAVLTQILRELINGRPEPELKQAPRGEAITRSIN